jgi:hypothetical protein
MEEFVCKSIHYMDDPIHRKNIEVMISSKKHLLFYEEDSISEWSKEMKKNHLIF